MRGNLAPDTAVAKPAAIAKRGDRFRGKAICLLTRWDACSEAIGKHLVKPHVGVIRYVGPKGGPGMPEMFKPMKLLYARG
jgi:dihydroxy-acid dehydratase